MYKRQPSAPGLERAGAAFAAPDMREMLAWPEVAGVAEVMVMRGVLDRSPKMSAMAVSYTHIDVYKRQWWT